MRRRSRRSHSPWRRWARASAQRTGAARRGDRLPIALGGYETHAHMVGDSYLPWLDTRAATVALPPEIASRSARAHDRDSLSGTVGDAVGVAAEGHASPPRARVGDVLGAQLGAVAVATAPAPTS
jgi:hypothetical protein